MMNLALTLTIGEEKISFLEVTFCIFLTRKIRNPHYKRLKIRKNVFIQRCMSTLDFRAGHARLVFALAPLSRGEPPRARPFVLFLGLNFRAFSFVLLRSLAHWFSPLVFSWSLIFHAPFSPSLLFCTRKLALVRLYLYIARTGQLLQNR